MSNDRFKYRVWDKKNKWWSDKTLVGAVNIAPDGGLNLEPDDQFIVQQCTGLKDSNDKLIFQGDIVEWGNEMWRVEPSYIGFELHDFPYYKHGDGYIDFPELKDGGSSLLTILGNVFENPELLNEDKPGLAY